VSFGDIPAASYTVVSDQGILATAPPGSGTVPVYVTAGGSNSVIGQYTYTAITSVTPAHGPAAGGTPVVITGTGLGSATEVLFGTTGAAFTQVSDTQIDAISPPGSGTQDISVQTPYLGTTPATPGAEFSYDGKQAATPLRRATGALARGVANGPAITPAPVPDISIASVIEELTGLAEKTSAFNEDLELATKEAQALEHPNCATSEEASAAALAGALSFLVPGIAAGLQFATLLLLPEEGALYLFLDEAEFEGALQAAIFKPLATLIVGAAAAAIVKVAYAGACGLGPQSDGDIDPSGTVLDTSGHPVKGATVTILRSYTQDGGYLPASTSMPGLIPAVNPETTGADGVFHWDVSAGFYKVEASAPGCTTATIGPYPVPPPRVGLTITLKCADEAKAAAPAVTGLTATYGPTSGGTVLTVLGTGFTPASKVSFGSTAAKSVMYLSQQALSVTAPKGSGLADVRVTTAGGTSAAVTADKFFFGAAPVVTKVSPAAGPAAGGTTVTITGTSFSGVTSVSFAGVPARKFTVKSATSITAVTAAATAGAATVRVANPAGSSVTGTFSYLAPVAAYVATSAGIVPVGEGAAKAGPVIKVAGVAGVAATPDGDTVLVAGSKGATEISTVSGQPGGTIPAGKTPKAVAVTPNGATAYVLNYGSSSVTPVNVSTGLAGKAVPVGSEPDAIAITPNGATAYVANFGSGTITPITIATGKAGAPIKVGTHPCAIAITPNGKTAYVVTAGSNSVTPVTVATGKAGKAIAVGKNPDAIAVTPNGATAYVVNAGSNSVTPITVATGRAGQAIPAGKDPDAIVVSPNGKTAYVPNGGSGTVTVITVATGKAGPAIPAGKDPLAVAITPDGTTAYILNEGSGTVTPIAVSTGKAGHAITVGPRPVAVAITR
jgi:YVTN family beta-propeller protein